MGATFGSCNDHTFWQRLAEEGFGYTFLRADVSISSSNETNFILIRNPSNSGILFRFNEIIMNLAPTVGGSQQSIFRFYRSPTITGVGTPMTVSKVRPSKGNNSSMLVYSAPTTSSTGTIVAIFSVNGNLDRNQQLSRFIEPNADVLITVQAPISNLIHSLTCTFAETPM